VTDGGQKGEGGMALPGWLVNNYVEVRSRRRKGVRGPSAAVAKNVGEVVYSIPEHPREPVGESRERQEGGSNEGGVGGLCKRPIPVCTVCGLGNRGVKNHVGENPRECTRKWGLLGLVI